MILIVITDDDGNAPIPADPKNGSIEPKVYGPFASEEEASKFGTMKFGCDIENWVVRLRHPSSVDDR